MAGDERYDRTDATGYHPVPLEGPVRFVAANTVVSVDGEVSAQIDGQVSATVAEIGRDESVRVSVRSDPEATVSTSTSRTWKQALGR